MKTIHRIIANGLCQAEGGLLTALNAYRGLLKREEESTGESTGESAKEREELIAMLKRVRELKIKFRYPGSVFNIYNKQTDEK